MLKRILLLVLFIFMGISVHASENYLHKIVIENTEDSYNILLNTDVQPDITKTIKNKDNIVIKVKNIKVSDYVNAIYKGNSEVNSLVMENSGNNEIKIYIQANNIANSTILSKLPDNTISIINERFPVEKVVWAVIVVAILALLIKSAKSITEYENSIGIKQDIKQREIELYRNFQRELSEMPKINSTINNAYASNIMKRSRRNYKELARL